MVWLRLDHPNQSGGVGLRVYILVGDAIYSLNKPATKEVARQDYFFRFDTPKKHKATEIDSPELFAS